jgi:uncharacterized membrane protein YgdD (TMEM256/DUF423 family)
MDHEAVIEAIELAALEPGGLDRLMAGDTATSQAVAAHLAGCASCVADLAAIGRDSRLIADVVATTPTSDLRERTLAAVRERGVSRGVGEAALPTAPTRGTPMSAPAPTAVAARRRATLGWVAAITAVLVVAIGATGAVLSDRARADQAAQAETIESLHRVTTATMAVAAEPDATSVRLAGTTDPTLAGSVLFSPSSTELVVVATGLIEPPAGQEYSCWMDAGAGRVRVGKMFFSDALAYWVGTSDAIAGLAAPAMFGVSLVTVGSPASDTAPVLLGQS